MTSSHRALSFSYCSLALIINVSGSSESVPQVQEGQRIGHRARLRHHLQVSRGQHGRHDSCYEGPEEIRGGSSGVIFRLQHRGSTNALRAAQKPPALLQLVRTRSTQIQIRECGPPLPSILGKIKVSVRAENLHISICEESFLKMMREH